MSEWPGASAINLTPGKLDKRGGNCSDGPVDPIDSR